MNVSALNAPAPGGLAWVLDQFEEIIACLAVAVVIFSVSWGVLTRYITAQPATWCNEVATLAFAWVVFFGSAACFKYRLHPAIDVLTSRMPAKLQAAVAVMNHALVLAFCAFMVWFGTRFAVAAWESPSAVLRLPLTWLYGPVAFSFALMIFRYVQILSGKQWQEADQMRETNAG